MDTALTSTGVGSQLNFRDQELYMVVNIVMVMLLYSQEPVDEESSTTTVCGFNYQLVEVMLLKQPNG